MSQLRKGRLPDGTRDIEVTGYGDVGRITFARYGVRGGGGEIVVGASVKYSGRVDPRVGKHTPKVRP
jgi:hypothetical protein